MGKQRRNKQIKTSTPANASQSLNIHALVDQRMDIEQEIIEDSLSILNNAEKIIFAGIAVFGTFLGYELLYFTNNTPKDHKEAGIQLSDSIKAYTPWLIIEAMVMIKLLGYAQSWLENKFKNTPYWNLVDKVFKGELDESAIDLKQLTEIKRLIKSEHDWQNKHIPDIKQILIILPPLLVILLKFPLLIATLLTLTLRSSSSMYSKESFFVKRENIDLDLVKANLDAITQNVCNHNWSSQTYKDHPIFSLKHALVDDKYEQLQQVLKQSGFNIIGKDPRIIVTRSKSFDEANANNSKGIFQDRINYIDAAEAFKQALKNVSRHFYRPWHFKLSNSNDSLELISTISFADQNQTRSLYQQLQPLLADNIERQFNTIIIRGIHNKEDICHALTQFKLPEIVISKASTLPIKTVPIRDPETEIAQPVTKLKTRGNSKSTPSMLSHFFSPRQRDTLIWNVAINGGFVTVRHNLQSEFVASSEDVKLLYSHGNIDYYAVLDTQNIPDEATAQSAQKAFELGYRPNRQGKTPGQCISEGDPKKDGCTHKIRLSNGARIKHYTAETKTANGQKAKLLYFSIYENAKEAHDQHRRIMPS